MKIFGKTLLAAVTLAAATASPLAHAGLGDMLFAVCNLACTWCDTAYTWDWSRYDASKELSNHSVDSVVARLSTMAIDTVVLTGGEPLLQQRRLVPLVQEFRRLRWKTHVETAGTIAWQHAKRGGGHQPEPLVCRAEKKPGRQL